MCRRAREIYSNFLLYFWNVMVVRDSIYYVMVLGGVQIISLYLFSQLVDELSQLHLIDFSIVQTYFHVIIHSSSSLWKVHGHSLYLGLFISSWYPIHDQNIWRDSTFVFNLFLEMKIIVLYASDFKIMFYGNLVLIMSSSCRFSCQQKENND